MVHSLQTKYKTAVLSGDIIIPQYGSFLIYLILIYIL